MTRLEAWTRRPFICEDCGKGPNCPMILEELWLTIATKKTLLCIPCTEQRLARPLTLADLETCLGNDFTVLHIAKFAPQVDVTSYQGYHRVRRALDNGFTTDPAALLRPPRL